ncbi:hypothetical protein K8Q96_02855 [Candidatus Nomurabacteria bacterium]|jgi:hypothetical protein|nr:hypothetical protein [Candidatus Nomurabacteria bacterium]
MDKKYLPSKQFIARLIIITISLGIIFGLYELTSFLKNRIKGKTTTVLVKDLVAKDSNNNSIPDWEESLWGLDPTIDGQENKEFIENKKKALAGKDSGVSVSESEQMSREFFALVTSLQQSGNLTEENMQQISDAVASQAVAVPIADIYTKDMQEIVLTSPTSIKKYHESFKKLTLKYANSDIGEELTFIYQGIQNNDQQALYAAGTVAKSYRDFGQELIKIPVPTSLQVTVLSLANNYEKSAQTIEDMENVLIDQLIGMRAIVNYKKYNDALITDLETMRTFFIRNGILKA